MKQKQKQKQQISVNHLSHQVVDTLNLAKGGKVTKGSKPTAEPDLYIHLIARQISVNHRLNYTNVRIALNVAFDMIGKALAAGQRVHINRFGSFHALDHSESQAYNPQTKERITVPAHKRIRFQPYALLRNRVNGIEFDPDGNLLNLDDND